MCEVVSQYKADVVERLNLDSVVWLKCRLPKKLNISAGQFFLISPYERYDVFLPRPISVFFSDGYFVEFLLQVKGKGTQAVSSEDKLLLRGPLGCGFDTNPSGSGIIVAGGMGIAGVWFVNSMLQDKKAIRRIWCISSKDRLLSMPEFIREKILQDFDVFSDDGSVGMQKDILEFVRESLDGVSWLICCGPIGMMEGLASVLKGKDIFGQFSLEAHMACGVGGCKGCRVEFCGRRLLVCKDGPVVGVNFGEFSK